MISILNSDIKTFRDLSIRQTYNLSKTHRCIAIINKMQSDPKQVSNLYDKLRVVQEDVENYPLTSFFRRLYDLITLNYFKMRSLRRSVPVLIEAIEKIAAETLSKAPSERITLKKSTIVEKKLEVTHKVLDAFHKQYSEDEKKWDKTAQEVHSYIIGRLMLLVDGQNVPLPRWFHATKADFWASIAKDKAIQQRSAAMGYGAFVSNNDEGENGGYGPFTFALDECAVYLHPGAYFHGRNAAYGTQEKFDSLWVRVESNIELSPKTVAYFTTTASADCHNAGERLFTDLNLDVPILTRKASECVRRLFDEVLSIRKLPSTWRRVYTFSPLGMPHFQEP